MGEIGRGIVVSWEIEELTVKIAFVLLSTHQQIESFHFIATLDDQAFKI